MKIYFITSATENIIMKVLQKKGFIDFQCHLLLTLKIPGEGQMALTLNLNDKDIPNADFFGILKLYIFF